MKKHLYLLLFFLARCSIAFAQENMGWKQFLCRENPNYYAICSDVERYFETQPASLRERAEDTDEEGSEYAQFMRWKWFWSTRIYADGAFPDVRETARLRTAAGARGPVTDRGDAPACGWQLISQNTCTGGYHGMGRTTSIAFHPTDTKTYYVGSPNGGVWKTTDGGDSYAPISEGLPYNGASCILLDYANPDVLYLSNGDHSGWWTYSNGIYKSTDGGVHWSPTGLTWPLTQGVAVSNADINPQNPSVLLVAASNGLYRTDNGGTTWTKVRDGYYSDVKFRPGDGNTVYAALHDYWGVSQVYKSTDGGVSWSKISDFTAAHNWIRLTVTPANPDLLAMVCSYDDSRKFYVSTTAGADLTYRSECPESAILFASPNNPNVLYCGYVNVYRSTDQGATWVKFTNWYGGQPEPEVHADEHFVAAQPGTPYVFFCNDGGLYRHNENTGAWAERSNGLIITQFYHIAVSQTEDVFMIGGTQDNGGRKRVAPGEWEPTNGGDAMEVAIDYTNADIMYTTYINGQLYRSLDRWTGDYTRISDNLPGQTPNHDLSGSWVAPYQIDPLSPNVLVLGYADVYRTITRGSTWTKISTNLTGSADEKLDALAIAPTDSKIIYASNGNRLYKTTNLGANWTSSTPPNSAAITSITVHPTNPDVVYITRGGYSTGTKVYRSDNGGANWTNISGSLPNVPTNCLYLDVAADGSYTLFVGNDLGVYYRTSTMSDWRDMNQNLPITVVTDLELQQSSRELRAGTFGRGIWAFDLGHLPGKHFSICPDNNRAKICLPQTYTATIGASAWETLSGPIALSSGPLPTGVTASFSTSTMLPGEAATVTFDLPAGTPEGVYPVRIFGAADGDTATAFIQLTIVSNDFSALALTTPAHGAGGVSRWPLLRWSGVPDANAYEIQLATNPAFDSASLVKTYANIKVDSLQWSLALDEGQVYYWRIRPLNECGTGAWTQPFAFATAFKSCETLTAADLPKNISANGTPTVESRVKVPNSGTIQEMKVKNVEGNHQFFKDLSASLVGPSGTEVVLFKNKCGSYSGGFRLGFDDAAPQPFGCPPPQNGNTYRPEGLLSSFNGQDAAGEWILRVKDNTISSGGQITGFAIEFCSIVAAQPPVIVHNQPLAVDAGKNAVIAQDLLKAEDPNTPAAQLVFTLLTLPAYGRLERDWAGPMAVGQTFTQADLDNGAVRYFDYGIPNAGDGFAFAVTDGEGGLATGVFAITQVPLSTSGTSEGLAFQLVPNPATERVRLSLPAPAGEDMTIRMFDPAGAAVRTWVLPAGESSQFLDLGHLPGGMYVLVLQYSGGVGLRPLAVQR